MLKRFADFIRSNHLFRSEDKILLAVSGGIDSMVMIDLFRNCGFDFGIAHCNFQLRGEESEADLEFVRSVAEKLNVNFYSEKFNTERYAVENKISIQMAARDLRYEWFEKTRVENDFDYIAAAHHRNDVLETVILNIIRGTGIAGLKGISPKQGKIIRPLLFASRLEIEKFFHQQKLEHREDASNLSTRYKRNFVRKKIVPLFREMNPAVEETVFAEAARITEAAEIFRSHVELIRKKLLGGKKGKQFIEIDELKKENPSPYILSLILVEFGFSESVSAEILNALDAQPGTKFISGSHIITRDREVFSVEELRENLDSADIEVETETRATEIHNGTSMLFHRKKFNEGTTIHADRNFACLDVSKLSFPLHLRKWESGDRFIPFGMSNYKKISDFLTDIKVPSSKKRDVMVLCSNSEIVWVAGHRIDDRFKVTPDTKEMLVAEIVKKPAQS